MTKTKEPSMTSRMIKLCFMTAMKDREGNVFKDDKGRITYLSSFPGVDIKVIPNPNSKCDGLEYILCVASPLTILPGLGEPLEENELSNEEQ
ncbi:MAG: hypothetical protein WBB67_03240 [bacterium]